MAEMLMTVAFNDAARTIARAIVVRLDAACASRALPGCLVVSML